MGKPGFYLYGGDYKKDTRCLTAEARGCYMDWLITLNEHGGSVTWPVANFAHDAGVSDDIARHVLHQLQLTKVAEVEWQNDSRGIAEHSRNFIAKLSNRRMVREAHRRAEIHENKIKAGRAGASRRWQNKNSKNSILPSPSPSLSSHKNEKKPLRVLLPAGLDPEVWDEFLAHRRRKRAPVTETIAERLFAKLIELENLGYPPNDVVRTMIDRNWTGLEVDWIHKGVAHGNEPEGFAGLRGFLSRKS